MNKSAIVAPIHQPHFERGRVFVKSYNKHFNDNDLYLVFSNSDEAKAFTSSNLDLQFNAIVCDEVLYCPKPITQKKIYGVKYIYNTREDIDYVAVIDVDTLFTKSFDYDTQFKAIVDNKTLYASEINNEGIRTKVSVEPAKKFFNSIDFEQLKQITRDFNLYWWFNDIPVYSREHFFDFLNYINYKEVLPKILYSDFDFILYSYYLLVNDIYRLKVLKVDGQEAPVQNKGSWLEGQDMFEAETFDALFKKYSPMWIKYPIAEESMKNVFIKLHTDRK